MSDDLIKRLADGLVVVPAITDGYPQADLTATVSLMSEAAAALTVAQAEIARLRGLAFSAYCEGWVAAGGHHMNENGWHVSESRSALSAGKGDA